MICESTSPMVTAISDVGFGMFRSQIEYKAKRYGTGLVIADRWYPSSRLCSVCDCKNEGLTLRDREWTCPQCGTHHDATTTPRSISNGWQPNCPTRGESVQPWWRCGRNGSCRSRGSHACQIRMWSARHFGAEKNVRTFAHFLDSSAKEDKC